MQTFLPYADFVKSAECLDNKRLGKQRVECLQLLQAITTNGSWAKHPAAKMWKYHVAALAGYGLVVCRQWVFRGYKDTCHDKIIRYLLIHSGRLDGSYDLPLWVGDRDLHASHRSNLLRKDRSFYGRYGWTEDDSLPYIWPEGRP